MYFMITSIYLIDCFFSLRPLTYSHVCHTCIIRICKLLWLIPKLPFYKGVQKCFSFKQIGQWTRTIYREDFFSFKIRHTKTTYKKKVQNICRNSKEVTRTSYGEKEGTFPFISLWPLTELPVWAEAVVLWEEALARPRVVLEALAAEGQRTYDR